MGWKPDYSQVAQGLDVPLVTCWLNMLTSAHPQKSWACQDGDPYPIPPLQTTHRKGHTMVDSEIISYSYPQFHMGSWG